MLTIGELSRVTGVKVPTIRYYEQMGLLMAPGRSGGNQRRYEPSERERLSFIKHARDLGFDLKAVRTLLALQEQPEASCENASRIAASQLEAVESRIVRLLMLRDELSRMVAECQQGAVAECRVIEALAQPPPREIA